MATKISYRDIGHKACDDNNPILRSSKVLLNKRARFYASFSGPQRGGLRLGRWQRIDEVYLKREDGYLYVGFLASDRDGLYRAYIPFCELDLDRNRRRRPRIKMKEKFGVDTSEFDNESYEMAQDLIQRQILEGHVPDQDYIEKIVDTVKKTVRCEDSLIRQILYTAASKNTADPQNLGILCPTSEGKT